MSSWFRSSSSAKVASNGTNSDSSEDEDDALLSATLSVECRLYDLGLLSAQVEGELSEVASPPPGASPLLEPTVGVSKGFGKGLQGEVQKVLDGLPPAKKESKGGLLSRLRGFAGLVGSSAAEGGLDDESLASTLMESREMERRREGLLGELAFLARLLGVPAGSGGGGGGGGAGGGGGCRRHCRRCC